MGGVVDIECAMFKHCGHVNCKSSCHMTAVNYSDHYHHCIQVYIFDNTRIENVETKNNFVHSLIVSINCD